MASSLRLPWPRSPGASPRTRLIRRERDLAAWKSTPATPLVPVPRKPGDPAFWVMTSGTTGVPKAVEHHHRNVGMCAEYYEQVLGCTQERPPVRDLALSLRLCDRQHVRGAADGCGQHPAGALGHRAERRRDGGALQADACCSAFRRSITGCSKRVWRRRRRFARFAISFRPASGCRRKSGPRGRTPAGIRSSTGSAARNAST